MNTGAHRSGRHFLQIPGPTNLPDRIMRAMSRPLIDHRGPEFVEFTRSLLRRLRRVFKATGSIVVYPASGTGAWEAALVNTLSPKDRVLAFETGHFATLWKNVAVALGLEVDWVTGDWRHGVDPAAVEERLTQDRQHRIKAVLVVHNETSIGATSQIAEIRKAIDLAHHPALFFVDSISSLGCTDYRHDDWGVDVTICGSQKGLMLPPGLSFNAISVKALEAAETARLAKSYWDWRPLLDSIEQGFFPYTPATSLLFGLDEALDMLLGEGLDQVFARHARWAEATRRAVGAWGLENLCANRQEYSNSTTAVLVPEGQNADTLREIIRKRFDMSLGTGLGRLKGKVFRIGHLGDFNDLSLAGTLSGIEMGLSLAGLAHEKAGVRAALDFLEIET